MNLKKIIQDFNNPELINNSPQTSPSHRLKNIFPRYRKVTHGRIIAQNITITHIRNKCKHFDEWCKKFHRCDDELTYKQPLALAFVCYKTLCYFIAP